MPSPFGFPRDFIVQKMRTSHIYQPVMLETLLTEGGSASTREIAAAILAHDESQLDYYEQIVKNMPGRMMASHGIAQRDGGQYRLVPDTTSLTEVKRPDLLARC